MPVFKPDQELGSYRLVRRIGAGGMGAVYEARHTVLQHRAAIKVLHSEGVIEPTALQRFINEARAAGQINHPGILKVYDFGQIPEDGTAWLAMEYLEGETLADRLKAHLEKTGQGLGESALWIPHEIASALAAAHGGGIIHRDLKPPNIMLVPDPVSPEGERVKVLDFGVAKLHAEQHTRRGAMLGTPAYMALEQIIDSAVVDGRADVFSLGVMMYECLAGRLPHKPGQAEVMLGKRMLEPITPIAQRVPAVSSALAELVMAMLSQEPGDRPSMAEVEQRLRSIRRLPPPRSSSAIVAVVPAAKASMPQTEDLLTPTQSAVGTLSARLLATPSGEHSGDRARGEVSPPQLAIPPAPPPSLSSLPSLPAPALPLRATPEQSTAQAVPTPLPPSLRATPSAVTAAAPSGPLSPRWAPWLLVVALIGLGGVLTVRFAPHGRDASPRLGRSPDVRGPGPLDPPQPGIATSQPAGGASALAAPASPLRAAESAAGAQVTASAPALPAPSEPGKAIPTTKPPSKSSATRCPMPTFTAACIRGHGQAQSAEVRAAVLDALRERPLRLCSGERLVIGMGANGVRVLEAPSRLSDAAQQDFLLTLRGSLDVTPRSGRIEILCPDRDH